MNKMRSDFSKTPLKRRQQGIALMVVMVILLLGTVLVLTTTRTTWLNETVVGSQSDYRRAYAAAEALMRDAENDVLGIRPGGGKINPNNPAFFEGSGRRVGEPFFPFSPDEDLDNVIAAIGVGGAVPCRRGICVPPNEQTLGNAWWDDPATFAAMTAGAPGTVNAIAATYGEFTGADPAAARNPLLTNTGARGAWYWVEVLQFVESANAAPAGLPIPDVDKQPFFFRITVVVQGQKPGSRVVLRSLFTPRPDSSSPNF